MRLEDNNNNPLDLNNLPDDSSRDPLRVFQDASASSGGPSRRERLSKYGKEYECRFCSLKFCKSQALGGHMNRHRQERETESLNKARELVLRNDSFPAPPLCYHARGVHIGETTPYRPMYPPRVLFSAAATVVPTPPTPPPLQPCLCPPPPSPLSRFPLYHNTNEYNLGHNGGGGAELPLCPRYHQTLKHSAARIGAPPEPNHTFIGAPIARGRGVPPPRHGL